MGTISGSARHWEDWTAALPGTGPGPGGQVRARALWPRGGDRGGRGRAPRVAARGRPGENPPQGAEAADGDGLPSARAGRQGAGHRGPLAQVPPLREGRALQAPHGHGEGGGHVRHAAGPAPGGAHGGGAARGPPGGAEDLCPRGGLGGRLLLVGVLRGLPAPAGARAVRAPHGFVLQSGAALSRGPLSTLGVHPSAYGAARGGAGVVHGADGASEAGAAPRPQVHPGQLEF
mmetsp:Transcript_9581/g.16010  ORF Transcript_9581/g.16010 Transcript_9581/m.16010 type:complete len:232 (+) Transcript_9581:200-895(+)